MTRPQKPVYWVLLAVAVVAMPLFLRVGCRSSTSASTDAKNKTLYQCPMHPAIVSSNSGNCPICGMRLTRVEQGSKAKTQSAAGDKGKLLYYRHPMRPDVTSPTPSKDEMGMDYIPVYEGGESSGEGAIRIPGHAEVFISPARQQLIGVQTEVVEERLMAQTIRTIGRVAYDPELYGFLSEYKEAVAAREKMKESPLLEVRERAEALVRSAALRLKLLGLGDAQITDFTNGDGASNLLLSSENAWIYADIYEYEAGSIKPGQPAHITAVALPGMRFEGTVKSVDAVFSAATRTLRARIEVPNTNQALKPEMFVDVVIESPLGIKPAIPKEAVFHAGETQLVFVDKGEGHIEPREIQVGAEAGGYVEVSSGLSAGEKVVRSANFLIDSESRFRAAAQGFKGSPKKPAEGKPADD